ncbi:hypothetical protein ACRAWF_27145 [Streptomyces sp. L7]
MSFFRSLGALIDVSVLGAVLQPGVQDQIAHGLGSPAWAAEHRHRIWTCVAVREIVSRLRRRHGTDTCSRRERLSR